MPFTIVLVGRPNVGKSTLFNRLVGRREALVHDQPGVTRDRREGQGRIADLEFTVIDTAGLEDATAGSLTARMRQQTEAAIAEADLCFFLIDAREGVSPSDEAFAAMARASDRPVCLIANKAESRAAETGILEGYSLGFGDPVPISAEHGTGLSDLYDVIHDAMAERASAEPQDPASEGGGDAGEPGSGKPLLVAIVGRPNAGKSTLINHLVGEDRLVTGPEAGITRDSIAIDWTWDDRAIRLFDTAGMRRKARVTGALEGLSVGDALRAIRFAEVVVLAMDATAPLEKQDLQIAALVAEEGRALVLALTKWDLVKNKQARLNDLRQTLDETLQQVRGVAMIPVSTKAGTGLGRLMQAVFDTHAIWNRRLPTAALNRWLSDQVHRHPPPAVSGRRIRLKYLSQTGSRPPTFYLSCSRPDALPDAYRRYLVGGLREDFDLPGVPIRLMLRRDRNPYETRKRQRTGSSRS